MELLVYFLGADGASIQMDGLVNIAGNQVKTGAQKQHDGTLQKTFLSGKINFLLFKIYYNDLLGDFPRNSFIFLSSSENPRMTFFIERWRYGSKILVRFWDISMCEQK